MTVYQNHDFVFAIWWNTLTDKFVNNYKNLKIKKIKKEKSWFCIPLVLYEKKFLANSRAALELTDTEIFKWKRLLHIL